MYLANNTCKLVELTDLNQSNLKIIYMYFLHETSNFIRLYASFTINRPNFKICTMLIITFLVIFSFVHFFTKQNKENKTRQTISVMRSSTLFFMRIKYSVDMDSNNFVSCFLFCTIIFNYFFQNLLKFNSIFKEFRE